MSSSRTMPDLKRRKPDLENKRDAHIILHLLRNFITTLEVVHLLYFADRCIDTPRKVLGRLCKQGYLVKYPLFGNKQHYYRLGQSAITRWLYPRSRMAKLGAQRLPYEVGTLAYTCLDSEPRKRLLPEELQAELPWFPEALMQWAYFFESSRLGTIRVEHRARPSAVVAKLSDQLYRYSEKPEFRSLIESGDFFFVVVTATEQQELAIRHEAKEQALSVELRTANYPELIRFI